MANLPEKNITTVNSITSIPSNTNIFINANGKLRQASIDNIIKASNVVSDAIDNQFMVLNGSSITAKTSKGVFTNFTAYGKSEQTQYSGKNELKCSDLTTKTINGVTFTPVYDNDENLLYVNVNGTATALCEYKIASNVEVLANEQILSGCPSGGSTSTYELQLYSSAQGGAIARDFGSGKATTISGTATAYILVRSGVAVSNLKFYPMISKEGGEYEPYVGNQPSPSPTYPQEIVSVGDKGFFDGELLQGYYDKNDKFVAQANTICGNNKIHCKANDNVKLIYEDVVNYLGIDVFDENGNRIESKQFASVNEMSVIMPENTNYIRFYVVQSNVTPSTAKHICVTINGMYALIQKHVNKNLWEYGNQEFTHRVTKEVNLKADTYTFSATVTSSDTDSTVSRVFFVDKNGTTIKYADLSRNKRSSITVECNRDVASIWLYSAYYDAVSQGDTATYSDIQLEQGDTMTDFAEHEHQTTYIPIAEPLRGIGEVKDEIACVDGVYGVIRRTLEKDFNGGEGWTYNAEYNYLFLMNKDIDTNIKAYAKVLCSHFKQETSVVNSNYCITTGSGTNLKNKDITSVADWLAWLTANPIKVVYELAEETFTPFADQTPFYSMKTFDGVTHISSEAEMDVEVPTSKAGGYASLGWAKSNLLEIELNNLIAKVNNVEVAVVNS